MGILIDLEFMVIVEVLEIIKTAHLQVHIT